MKALFLSLVSMAIGSLSAFGQSAAGAIMSVDEKAQTVTVAAGREVVTYRLRPSSEIMVNGSKAQFPALAAGMQVRVTQTEPGIAGKIVATSVAAGLPQATSPAAAALQAGLADSKWNWRAEHGKAGNTTVIFGKEEGFFSDNPAHKYPWKALDGKTVEFGEHRFVFNATATEFECANFGGRGKRWGHRLP